MRDLYLDIEKIIVSIIKNERKNKKVYGLDKTYNMIKPFLKKFNIKAGRDKVRQIMRDYGLKIKKKKQAKYYSPNVDERSINLIYGKSITRCNQVWLTDFTFIRTKHSGTLKVALVMDAKSRRILGYNVSRNSYEAAYKAMKMAMVYGKPEYHHSDQGFEYTNPSYCRFLEERGIKLSYSRAGVPQDNGIMERTIGTLKNELDLKRNNINKQDLINKTEEVVRFFNDERIHWSLKFKTPSSVYFYNLFCHPILA